MPHRSSVTQAIPNSPRQASITTQPVIETSKPGVPSSDMTRPKSSSNVTVAMQPDPVSIKPEPVVETSKPGVATGKSSSSTETVATQPDPTCHRQASISPEPVETSEPSVPVTTRKRRNSSITLNPNVYVKPVVETSTPRVPVVPTTHQNSSSTVVTQPNPVCHRQARRNSEPVKTSEPSVSVMSRNRSNSVWIDRRAGINTKLVSQSSEGERPRSRSLRFAPKDLPDDFVRPRSKTWCNRRLIERFIRESIRCQNS